MDRHITIDERIYYKLYNFCMEWGLVDAYGNPNFNEGIEKMYDDCLKGEDLKEMWESYGSPHC